MINIIKLIYITENITRDKNIKNICDIFLLIAEYKIWLKKYLIIIYQISSSFQCQKWIKKHFGR